LIYAKPNQAQWLIDSGMKSCFFGIESLHPEASKMVGKGWSGKHGKDWLPKLQHEIWKNKANFTMAFIIGLEPETKDDIYKTQDWCIENKMSDWTWASLYIRNINSGYDTSEFEKNAEQYGYTMIPGTPADWTSKNWTSKEANLLYRYMLKMTSFERKLSGWHLMEASTVGYEVSDIINKPLSIIDKSRHKEKCADLLHNYFSRLKNLK